MSPRELIRDERGVVALLGALLLPVLLGAGALVVDMSQHRLASNRMQGAADAGALAAAQLLDDQRAAIASAVDFAGRNVPATFGDITLAEDVTFGAYDPASGAFAPSAKDVNAVRVTARRDAARGNAAPRLLAAIFGSDDVSISVSAIAARSVVSDDETPQLTKLKSAPGQDYDEFFVYCFKYAKSGAPENRRSSMTRILHNIDTTIKYKWPTCGKDETLSYRFTNYQGKRSFAEQGKSIPGQDYDYFSDTTYQNGREVFDAGFRSMLETIRCDTLAECSKPLKPNNLAVHHTPAADSCAPGKFLYFGWDNHPHGSRDYDDVRFVLSCPSQFGAARLVR